MRLGIWAYTAAVTLAAFAIQLLGESHKSTFFEILDGKPLPGLTVFVLNLGQWFFLLPIAWIIAAVWLSRREAATQSRCAAFAGISTLAITFLLILAMIAYSLPLISVAVGLER